MRPPASTYTRAGYIAGIRVPGHCGDESGTVRHEECGIGVQHTVDAAENLERERKIVRTAQRHRVRAIEVRLLLGVIAYNLANLRALNAAGFSTVTYSMKAPLIATDATQLAALARALVIHPQR